MDRFRASFLSSSGLASLASPLSLMMHVDIDAFASFSSPVCIATLIDCVATQVLASNEPGIVAFALIAPSRVCEEQHKPSC